MTNLYQISFDSYSFGCRVNKAETENINRELLKRGFLWKKQNPDIYILNSCAITKKAEREVRQHIYHYHSIYPKTRIYLIGCAAILWEKLSLYKTLPVERILDKHPKNIIKLAQNSFLHNTQKQKLLPSQDIAFSKFVSSGRIIVKIQDGCSRYCTYCVVPYLRGKPISNKVSHIVKMIKKLSNQKIYEVILTAVNTADYGKDSNESIIYLLQTLILKTNVPRISFGSIHPFSINQDIISLYKDRFYRQRLVRFFHIPLQSASSKILHIMKRDYTFKSLNTYVNGLYEIDDTAFFSTDIITGYLGETEEEYTKTYNNLKKSRFVRFHVFPFSLRPNTAAWFMKKRYFIPSEKIKKERGEELRKLSNNKYISFCKKLVGKNFKALFLIERKNSFQKALLENNVPIYIHTNKHIDGIVDVIVEDFDKNSLYGKLV